MSGCCWKRWTAAFSVPALWLGTESTAASDPGNWSDGMLSGEWDVVQFSGDYSVNCVGLFGNYSVLSASAGYTGTVTLGGSATITEFSMLDGTVIAPSSLSSYSSHTYGGTLDVQSIASFWGLSMYGGSATIGGAATLDNLSVHSTASVTLESGGTVGYAQIFGRYADD